MGGGRRRVGGRMRREEECERMVGERLNFFLIIFGQHQDLLVVNPERWGLEGLV